MPKQLKFRLTVTIDELGVLASAELRVRDAGTRETKSLGGWPIPGPDTDASLNRLFDAIKNEIVSKADLAGRRKREA